MFYMTVLVMGHRRGITKALDRLGIPYVIWSHRTLVNKTRALKQIEAPYPQQKSDLETHLSEYKTITHVIAGAEESVVPASKVRQWAKARRNPHSVIVKCTDKLKMKDYLKVRGVPMTDFIAADSVSDPSLILQQLGAPLVSKPRRSSGGRGIEKIADPVSLAKRIKKDTLFERLIHGQEGSVESLVVEGEIRFCNITDYRRLGHCNMVPGQYPSSVQQTILDLNQQVIQALNIQWGMTHLEFYQTQEQILFGEIALRPPGGYIMEALQLAYGADFWDLFVRVELELPFHAPQMRQSYAAAMVFHPEEGEVVSLRGFDELKQNRSLRKFKIKIREGQKVNKREGVGQDIGYALLSNTDTQQLLRDIEQIEQTFIFELKK